MATSDISEKHYTSLVMDVTRPAYGARRLSPPVAEPATDLARCRRHTRLLYSRRHPRTTADGRDHWGRAAPFSAADRPLPLDRSACRPFSRPAQGGHPLVRLRGRPRGEGGR